MYVSELYKCPLLTEYFGESRTFEVVRTLRDKGVISKERNYHVTTRDLAILIYCLACSERLKDVEICLETLNNLKNEVDTYFLDAFVLVLAYEHLMKESEQILFSQKDYRVIFSGDKFQAVFADMVHFEKSQTPDTEGINSYIIIDKSWFTRLRAYATRCNLATLTMQNSN